MRKVNFKFEMGMMMLSPKQTRVEGEYGIFDIYLVMDSDTLVLERVDSFSSPSVES